jgi:hypothetical protein
MLEDFFQSDETQVVCFFLQSALKGVRKTNSSFAEFESAPPRNADHCEWIEGSDFRTPGIELFGGTTMRQLQLMQLEDPRQANALEISFSKLYATVLEYIDKWYRLESSNEHFRVPADHYSNCL